MKKQFLVIDLNDASFNYIVDDLDILITEMYEVELGNGEDIDTVTGWFLENHKVFEIEGTISEFNQDYKLNRFIFNQLKKRKKQLKIKVMKNKSIMQEVVDNCPTMVVAETVAEVKQLGRPVDPNSERQKRLAELEAKRSNGELRRGRPVNGTSERQKRLAEMAARAAANGGTVKRGRPSNGDSERQKRLAERAAKAASGVEIKRGRPAMTKVEEQK